MSTVFWDKDRSRDTTMSAHDLLPEEDRDAIAWVREQGGLEEIRKRLMPEGYEWPRYESGGPVGIGGRFTDRSGIGRTVAFISFYDSDFSIRAEDGTIHFYKYGEPLGPEPVLAADGKPLEVGQTVYGIEDGAEYKVCGFDEGGPIVEYWSGGICVHGCASPTQLTHQRPRPRGGQEAAARGGARLQRRDRC